MVLSVGIRNVQQDAKKIRSTYQRVLAQCWAGRTVRIYGRYVASSQADSLVVISFDILLVLPIDKYSVVVLCDISIVFGPGSHPLAHRGHPDRPSPRDLTSTHSRWLSG